MKAGIKEEVEAHSDSSGYISDVASLDEEENLKDTTSESAGRLTLHCPWTPEFGPRTSSPACGTSLSAGRKTRFNQVLRVQAAEGQGQATCSLDDDEQQGEGKEQPQEEAFIEEEPPWGHDPCLEWFVSGGGFEPPDAPELCLRPPQVGGPADDEWEPWPSLFWGCGPGPPINVDNQV